MKAKNFNLDRYLERIDYHDKVSPTFDTLKKIHLQQIMSIPFENLDVMEKKEISLQPEDIVTKLVNNKRGGYCYEVNGLLAIALQEIGFHYNMLIARPRLNHKSIRPKTHMILQVFCDGKEYLCDTGFGGYGILEPIELIEQDSITQLFDEFALKIEENEYFLKMKTVNGFEDLYSFDLLPQKWIDYTLANYFNSHSKDTLFTNKTIVSLPVKDKRIFLIDNVLKYVTYHKIEEIKIDDKTEVLKEQFKLFL